MIPKIIHYCWFSGEEFPPFISQCIETWKKNLPEYTFKLWDENSFDFYSVPFVKEAFVVKKWAFVTDYVRFYALYNEGGIYMDSDVKVFKPFPANWFNYRFFSAHEYHPGLFDTDGIKKLTDDFLPINPDDDIDGFSIQAAIMGSTSKHPFLKDCMNEYHNISFLNEDGSMKKTGEVIIGAIIGRVAIKYGYRYINEEQILKENMLILPANVLVGNAIHLDKNSYAIHLINGSWLEKKGFDKLMHNVRNNYPKLFPIFNVVNKMRIKLKRAIGV